MADKEARSAGGFTATGSWNRQADGEDDFTRWVWALARDIQAQRLTPRQARLAVVSSPWGDRFSEAVTDPKLDDGWDSDRFELWPLVPCRRSCDEALKRAATGRPKP